MCQHNPDDIHTLHSSHYRNSSHWLAHLQSKWRVWLLKSCATVFSGCVVVHHTYCTHYMVHVHVSDSLILPRYLTCRHRCVMKIQVHTAVSETPYFCLIVHLCVSMFECVCSRVCVFASVWLFISLYVCHGSNKAAGNTQIKRKQRNGAEIKQKRQNERHRQRERVCQSLPILLRFSWWNKKRARTHTHKHVLKKNKASK